MLEQVEASRSSARDRGISIKMKVPDDLPEVLAEPSRIGQVLANLLSNALRYTSPGGEVCVSAWSDDSVVHFEISDTGQGIPAEYLDRVFEQFFRVPGQPPEEGECLGLAIARDIVEAHGGTIDVESREEKGSTFTFSLRKRARAIAGDS